MKLFATVSFISFILLSAIAFAQINKYDASVSLEDGKSLVKLSITFVEPIDSYKMTIFGKIRNFNASSTAPYPINCNLTVSEASLIDCSFTLTQDKKTISLSFETNDFVKILNKTFYFSGDFTVNEDIRELSVIIKLPEGMALSGAPPHEISPPEVAITSDGRKIILMWKYTNVTRAQPLRFQVLYESTVVSILPWEYILIGIAIAGGAIFFVFRRIRKPKEVILSVLDDYEKKVIDIITANGGEVNQKKVVQETNLSKAKVSRIVKNLVGRGLIEAQRVGRTNKLKLVKKKFEF